MFCNRVSFQLAWLRLRNLLIRTIAASVQFSIFANSGCVNGNAAAGDDSDHVTILNNLKVELAEHLKASCIYEKPYDVRIKVGGTEWTLYLRRELLVRMLSARLPC